MVLVSISTQFWKLAFTQNPAHKCLIGPLSDSPIWMMFFNKWKVQRTFDPSVPWSAIQHLAASQENWMTPQTMTVSKTRPLPKDSIRFHSGSDRIIELDNKLVISRVWYRGEVKGSRTLPCAWNFIPLQASRTPPTSTSHLTALGLQVWGTVASFFMYVLGIQIQVLTLASKALY